MVGSDSTAERSADSSFDEVSIWNVRLSAHEIKSIYDKQVGGFGAGKAGIYKSKVFDSKTNKGISDGILSWAPSGPYGIEVPSSAESGYDSNNVGPSFFANLEVLANFNDSGSVANGSSLAADYGRNFDASNLDGSGFQFTSGKFGNALTFDGNDDHLVITDPALDDQPLGISAWIFLNDTSGGSGGQKIIAQKTDGGDLNGWYFEIYNNSFLRFVAMNGSSAYLSKSTNERFPLQKWTHVAVTWDGTNNSSEVRIYIDGKLCTTRVTNTGGTWGSNAGNSIRIGRNTNVAQLRAFNGRMDDFMLWSRTISSSEVETLYQRGGLNAEFQVRSCDESDCSDGTFVGPSSNPSQHYDASHSPGLISPETPALGTTKRYIQYKAVLSTENPAFAPTIKEVSFDGN